MAGQNPVGWAEDGGGGRALDRVGEYDHAAEAVADEVLASTTGGSQGCVCGDRHAFSS